MTIEIVDFPIKNGGSFNSYVKLPEGMSNFFLGVMTYSREGIDSRDMKV